jgi:cold shock CspA family protein
MQNKTNKGTLVKWQDDKGFGFIKSATDGKEIFLHISAIPKASRRPQVGDTIIYQLTTQDNGKLKADSARIEGVKLQNFSNKQNTTRHQKNSLLTKLVGFIGILIGISAMVIISDKVNPSKSPPIIQSIANPNCKIKGNISQTSGKRYCHVPGMEDYESTTIDPSYGEKWFCTEQ